MHSALFEHRLEEPAGQRFSLQNPQLLRVRLGEDILAVKGTMVAHQGALHFDHERSESTHRRFRRPGAGDDVALMRIAGEGEVFFASESGYVFLVELTGDSVCVNAHNLLAFDSAIEWDLHRVQGAGSLSGGLFTARLTGTGTVAVHTVGQPVVLDCSQQPTHVDVQACAGWSGGLEPQVAPTVNVRSLLRGGVGEAFQYTFHGPGFVVVQPGVWIPPQQGGGFDLGGLLDG
jgi:uncharacterized protein (AIM24 family)